MIVNRLSGYVPTAIIDANPATTVNIIQGNLFGCPLLRNDISSKETSCGSSNLEHPFLAWLVLVSITSVLMMVVRYSRADIVVRIRQHIHEWRETSCRYLSPKADTSDDNGLYHTNCAMKCLEYACSMSIILTTFFILIVMVSFIAIKLHDTSRVNSLYQIQYLYTTTAAYFIGEIPTVLLWLYVSVSGLMAAVSIATSSRTYLPRAPRNKNDTNDDAKMIDYRGAIRAIASRLVVGIIVTLIALVINYGFVRIVYFSNTTNLSLVNLAFAIIKSVYSSTIIPYSSKLVPKSSLQVHMVMISIVVNVISPGLVVLLSSPLCLYYKLKPTSITAFYVYTSYSCINGECKSRPMDASSTITPQWFYSYQCSSSFLTSYLPNFVYLYIINGIISPSFDILAMILSSTGTAARCRAYLQSVSASCSVLFNIYDMVAVGRVFLVADKSSSVSEPSNVEMHVLDDKNTAHRITTVFSAADQYGINVTKLLPSLCVDITLLLTFGLASPLLAVVISYSIIINTLLWYIALGRYIAIVSKESNSSTCYDHLEIAYKDTWRCLSEAWWIMSIFIGMFWSLFINDMIGDKNPTAGIALAVVMMIWCPLVFLLAQKMLAVNTDITTTSNATSSIGDYILNISLSIHNIIWSKVFHATDSTTINTMNEINNLTVESPFKAV